MPTRLPRPPRRPTGRAVGAKGQFFFGAHDGKIYAYGRRQPSGDGQPELAHGSVPESSQGH